jgi:hypothetical protein
LFPFEVLEVYGKIVVEQETPKADLIGFEVFPQVLK